MTNQGLKGAIMRVTWPRAIALAMALALLAGATGWWWGSQHVHRAEITINPEEDNWRTLGLAFEVCPDYQRETGDPIPPKFVKEHGGIQYADSVMEPLRQYVGIPLSLATCRRTGMSAYEAPCTSPRLKDAAVTWCGTPSARIVTVSPSRDAGEFHVTPSALEAANAQPEGALHATLVAYADYLVMRGANGKESTASQRACFVGAFSRVLRHTSTISPQRIKTLAGLYRVFETDFTRGHNEPQACLRLR